MRRLAILAAGMTAILPEVVQGAETASTQASPQSFVAPVGPVILTRTLRRGLPDGQEIVSTRRYEVRIVPEGEGFRVDGKLIEVTLDAPPSLAALAEIERKRSDEGLFPFQLDAGGLIASQATSRDGSIAAPASQVARATIATSPLGEADRQAAQTIADRILSRGVGSGGQWPIDLFRPFPGRRSETSQVADGKVTTTVETRRSTQGAPADVIERTVTTETGGTQRISREVYRVELAGG